MIQSHPLSSASTKNLRWMWILATANKIHVINLLRTPWRQTPDLSGWRVNGPKLGRLDMIVVKVWKSQEGKAGLRDDARPARNPSAWKPRHLSSPRMPDLVPRRESPKQGPPLSFPSQLCPRAQATGPSSVFPSPAEQLLFGHPLS